MQIDNKTEQNVNHGAKPALWLSVWKTRGIAILLATVATFSIRATALHLPPGDTDGLQYVAMANGERMMKPFAFRFLAPAVVRIYAHIVGSSVDRVFLLFGLIGVWVILCGVLSLVLRRSHGISFALILTVIPFWLRTFIDYQLPDLPHAALCMVYLLLLRRRWWGWASVLLTILYLTRESTLLIAVVAVPVLWRWVGRRIGLMHLGAALVGMLCSKFAARHALPNHQNMNDTLYMIAKIPWNLSRNIFGVTLWSNTMQLGQPLRVWNLPHWIHAGDIHQVGYTQHFFGYQIFTFCTILSSFGIGFCVVLCLWWRTPLRTLLPRDKPYLCIAAIYGAAAYFLAPMLGAAETRLLDYGWPLFLVYLPAAMLIAWRSAPPWAIYTLVVLNFIDAWTDPVWKIFGFSYINELPVILFCNLVAAWLLLRTKSQFSGAVAFD